MSEDHEKFNELVKSILEGDNLEKFADHLLKLFKSEEPNLYQDMLNDGMTEKEVREYLKINFIQMERESREENN